MNPLESRLARLGVKARGRGLSVEERRLLATELNKQNPRSAGLDWAIWLAANGG